MSENKLNTIKELKLNLTELNAKEILAEAIDEFRHKGFDNIAIKIESSATDLIKKSGYDMESYNQIKELQNLPGWVVYDLIHSSGKLKGTGFNERVTNAEK
jgi:enolase